MQLDECVLRTIRNGVAGGHVQMYRSSLSDDVTDGENHRSQLLNNGYHNVAFCSRMIIDVVVCSKVPEKSAKAANKAVFNACAGGHSRLARATRNTSRTGPTSTSLTAGFCISCVTSFNN